MKRNEAVLNNLPGHLYTTEANDKISDNSKYPVALTQGSQNQKQRNTRGFANLRKIKIGSKDHLINDQM